MKSRVIGLTGGVASGKSEAASYLSELGAGVIDADKIAREVVEIPEIRRSLKELWPEVFQEDALDRKALAKIIFSSREERDKLNHLLHPPIVKKLLREVETCGSEVCVLVAPLLIETGLHQVVDEVWVMDASRENQIERLMKREGLSKEDAVNMIESQLSSDIKLAHAHLTINNNGTPGQTHLQLKKAWDSLIARKA